MKISRIYIELRMEWDGNNSRYIRRKLTTDLCLISIACQNSPAVFLSALCCLAENSVIIWLQYYLDIILFGEIKVLASNNMGSNFLSG